MAVGTNTECPLCGSVDMTLKFVYNVPPPQEKRFPDIDSSTYYRELWKCELCGLFQNVHSLFDESIYFEDYVDVTYGANNLFKKYNKILSLPKDQSDNAGRVRRIIKYISSQMQSIDNEYVRGKLLDVGSGLGVFAHVMAQNGWDCTCVDPDPRSAEHIKNVGMNCICTDFRDMDSSIGRFDLITFNKVLEHIWAPVAVLAKSKQYMDENSNLYIEVPDGEMAQKCGFERGEFNLCHTYVFSLTALSLLLNKAGFTSCVLARIKEPSGKYTIYAFASC